jgi:hypothetical protein
MSRDKEVLTNPVEKAHEQIIIKIGYTDVSIKEIEGPIVIDNLDQSDAERLTVVGICHGSHPCPQRLTAALPCGSDSESEPARQQVGKR